MPRGGVGRKIKSKGWWSWTASRPYFQEEFETTSRSKRCLSSGPWRYGA